VSVSRATSTATPAAARQATIAWVPRGCRLNTTSVASATTPTTTARVEPSDSVTRTRPVGRVSWPTTPATNAAAVTYASGASEAGSTQTAEMSAPTAAARPTPATTRGAGGRDATVQASTNRT
jgi:hypothetical protein